jgi:predicted O-methyltransferase YrrM
MYSDTITGWFNEGQRLTYDKFVELSSVNEETNILEIGCFLGKSSMYLAENIKKSKKPIKLHCVDFFRLRDGSAEEPKGWPKNKNQKKELESKYGTDLLPQFKDHIKKLEVENIVKPYQMSSDEALNYFIQNDIKFDFIFIDGGHDYEIVKNDIIKSLKVLKKNGIIAGDDYFTSRKNDQVQKAVDEIFGNNAKFFMNQTFIVGDAFFN